MAGPSAATRSPGREPKASAIARTAAWAMPATVPRQPACARPMASRCGSYRRMGTQSAKRSSSGTPGSSVISPSQAGMKRPRCAAPTRRTSALCTCRGETTASRGTPSAAHSRRWFSSTACASSPEAQVRLSAAKGGWLTPPRRVDTA